MENHRSLILVSQPATEDMSKNAEPPPKLIFCCLRSIMRNSNVSNTICKLRLWREFLDSAEVRNTAHLGMFTWPKDIISIIWKVNNRDCFSVLSFCYLEYSSMTHCLRPVKVEQSIRHCKSRANASSVLPGPLLLRPASWLINPSKKWPHLVWYPRKIQQ